MPNRLTPFNFKIYYKEENYLKVKTAVFKYMTPPIVKVRYVGMSVRLVYKYISISVRLVYILLYNSATPCPTALLVLTPLASVHLF